MKFAQRDYLFKFDDKKLSRNMFLYQMFIWWSPVRIYSNLVILILAISHNKGFSFEYQFFYIVVSIIALPSNGFKDINTICLHDFYAQFELVIYMIYFCFGHQISLHIMLPYWQSVFERLQFKFFLLVQSFRQTPPL